MASPLQTKILVERILNNETSTVVNDIKAGASGQAGTLQVYPATASKGYLKLAATASTGNTVTTITNAAQATTRTYTIPDAGASADFVMNAGAQTIAGNKTFTGTTSIGTSGTVGVLDIYPTTASKGKLRFSVIDNAGDTTTTFYVSPQAGTRTYTLPDHGASATFLMTTGSGGLPGQLRIPLSKGRCAAGGVVAATAAAGTDFVLALSADGVETLEGHASQNNSKTDDIFYTVTLPNSYKAGTNLSLTIHAGYTLAAGTTVTATVDAIVKAVSDANVAGSDLCATAATAITDTYADKIFTITGTSLNPGDKLAIKVTTVVAEAGNTGTATGKVYSVRLS